MSNTRKKSTNKKTDATFFLTDFFTRIVEKAYLNLCSTFLQLCKFILISNEARSQIWFFFSSSDIVHDLQNLLLIGYSEYMEFY